MYGLLKGAPVASALNELTKRDVESLAVLGIKPRLAIVRVGERGADLAYERSAVKRCALVGVDAVTVALPCDVTQDGILEAIHALNSDSEVHGILLLRPLPPHLDEAAVCENIDTAKDVDGVTMRSLAGVFAGRPLGFAPCTAEACIEVLDHYGVELKGARAVVVGRSLVVGKPAAMLLLARHATVTVCHTRTGDLSGECQNADILIVAAGRAGLIGESCLSARQIVVDVGIHACEDGALRGDVDYDYGREEHTVRGITPVPGGVGTVTTSLLVRHTAQAALRMVR